jgi:hypothetical protein
MAPALMMRRVARIPSGPYAGFDGRVVCCDSDHDSMPELIFHTGTIHPSDPLRNEVWEHQGWNRFSLVFADTGEYPEPPGITTGNAIPFAAGDIDNDGLTDIVCITVEPDSSNPDKFYDDVITIESPDSFSYPCSLSWYFRYDSNTAIPDPVYYPPDLDQDGRKEIIKAGGWVWENTGNNQNQLVWHGFGFRYTFGDFDTDGKMNFASASLNSNGIMVVWECTGDDQYQTVYRDTVRQPNGADVFMTNDIDGDGLPEFYVAYENVPRGKMYLYMWEAYQAGTDSYRRTLVDSVGFSGTDWGRISECGDIDGDGIDELIWTTPNYIKMYKVIGNLGPREVWSWYNDHGGFRSLVSTVYDINNDGYNELITAGNAKVSIFEVDAVDLVSPNGGSYSVGDTVSIRWVTNTPPRCDSLSLFLRCDSVGLPPLSEGLARLSAQENRACTQSATENGGCTQSDSLWHLQTIATGLPGTDTLYRWVVPSGVPDTGRIIVMAYGPGWQYDISDSVITFIGGGVAERIRNVPLQWALSVSPNPARGAFTVRYDVPGKWGQSQPLRGQTEVQSPFSVSLGIYDVDGRLVRSLSEGEVVPGRYEAKLPSGTLPAGIYFLRLDTPGFRSVKKAVVAR